MILSAATAAAAIFGGLIVGLTFYLVWKCMKIRSQRKQLKEHMQMRKHQFATQMGLSVFELDSRVAGPTVHI